MERTYSSDVAFTPTVKAIQARKGSRRAYANQEQAGGWQTEITPDLKTFVEAYLPEGVPSNVQKGSSTPCDVNLPLHLANALSCTDEPDATLVKRYQSLTSRFVAPCCTAPPTVDRTSPSPSAYCAAPCPSRRRS